MGIQEDIELKTIGKLIKPTDKPLSDEFADRVRWSALASLSAIAAAAAPALPALIKRKISLKDAYKLRKVPVMVSGTSMIPVAWNAPRVHNAYLKYVQGKAGFEEPQEAYNKLIEEQANTVGAFTPINKKASLLSTANRIGSGLGTGIGKAFTGTRKFIGKGIVGTPKIVPTASGGMRRTFGGGLYTWGTRGAVGALGGTGAFKGYQLLQSKRKLSGKNYTTFLRNNILSGNIQPNQLSQNDLISVRKLGMR